MATRVGGMFDEFAHHDDVDAGVGDRQARRPDVATDQGESTSAGQLDGQAGPVHPDYPMGGRARRGEAGRRAVAAADIEYAEWTAGGPEDSVEQAEHATGPIQAPGQGQSRIVVEVPESGHRLLLPSRTASSRSCSDATYASANRPAASSSSRAYRYRKHRCSRSATVTAHSESPRGIGAGPEKRAATAGPASPKWGTSVSRPRFDSRTVSMRWPPSRVAAPVRAALDPTGSQRLPSVQAIAPTGEPPTR